MKRMNKLAVGILLLGQTISGAAFAATVTLAGTTASFTFDSALSGLFGAPTVIGDTLYFTPTTYKAQSFNGSGLASASQTFNIMVNANPGYLVSAVNLTENGDYYNMGAGASVAVGGKLYVRDLESPLAPAAISKIKATLPLTDVTSMANFETTDWTSLAGVAIPAGWGGADGIVGGVNVTIENILLASSLTSGSAAFIEKKFVGLNVVMAPVPEPSTYAMMLAGLGLVGVAVRRRAKM
ncbi:MAG: PEP-CTERM sorting domain-containing protein [Hydrogenophilales bacterium]|nr:PEP-CTERM sorting domain-containing protein [Hydrogenophilales bacterium]